MTAGTEPDPLASRHGVIAASHTVSRLDRRRYAPVLPELADRLTRGECAGGDDIVATTSSLYGVATAASVTRPPR